MTADEWNASYPPGTPVIYEGPDGGEHIETRVVGYASEDSGAVLVRLEGRLWCEVHRIRPAITSLGNLTDKAINAALEAAACAIEALPDGTWGDESGARSPWGEAAKVVRARKIRGDAPPHGVELDVDGERYRFGDGGATLGPSYVVPSRP